MRKLLILILSLIVNLLFGQNNCLYYKNTIANLKANPNIKDVKFIEKTHKNTQVGFQAIFVRYNVDSISDNYYNIGKTYAYYNTGQLSMYHNVSIDTGVLKDTMYVYSPDGCIKTKAVFENDTSRIYSTKYLYNFFGVFKKYFIRFPKTYKEVKYENCFKSKETPYLLIDKGYLIDGIVYEYGKKGDTLKRTLYNMGVTESSSDSLGSLVLQGFEIENDDITAIEPDSSVIYYDNTNRPKTKLFFKNGREIKRRQYNYGLLFNIVKTTHKSLKHGIWEKYYKNGMIKERRFYERGKPVGIWSIWDKKGILFVETNFEKDTVVRRTYQYQKNKKTILVEQFDKRKDQLIDRKKIIEPINVYEKNR